MKILPVLIFVLSLQSRADEEAEKTEKASTVTMTKTEIKFKDLKKDLKALDAKYLKDLKALGLQHAAIESVFRQFNGIKESVLLEMADDIMSEDETIRNATKKYLLSDNASELHYYYDAFKELVAYDLRNFDSERMQILSVERRAQVLEQRRRLRKVMDILGAWAPVKNEGSANHHFQ